MAEFSPELNEQILASLERRIRENQAREVASARGEAVRRGVVGGSFEGRRVGAAVAAGGQQSADAAIQLAIENATRLREERLIKEDQTYRTSERSGSEAFSAGENQKQRDYQDQQRKEIEKENAEQQRIQREWQSLENDKSISADERRAALDRDFQASQARKQGRIDLIGAGANLVGTVAGSSILKGGGLFGAGAAGGAGAGGTAGVGGVTSAAGGAGAGLFGLGALGYAANVGLSSGAGQVLGKGLFKSNAARTASRKAAQIGAIVGGLPGAAAGSVIGGVKKLFCFSGETPVEMANGSTKQIKDIALDDVVRGGRVHSISKSKTPDGTVFDYGGILVSGSHAVFERGTWIRVQNSVYAKPVSGEMVVYSFTNEQHRIFVNGIEFSDERESDWHEHLTIDDSLSYLNRKSDDLCFVCGSKSKKKRGWYYTVKFNKKSPKKCDRCFSRAYGRKHKKWNAAKMRKWRRTPKGRYKFGKDEARKRSLSWTITPEEHVAMNEKPCFYCGCAIGEYGAGLDRVDNSRGYDADNVLPCCRRCNTTRSDNWTVEETKAMIAVGLSLRNKLKAVI